MDVHFALDPAPAVRGAITFGNFDGVHLGHRSLVRRLRELAREVGGPATIVTFEPHPMRLLRPHHAPPALDTLERRLDLLQEAGADAVIVLTFDEELAGRSPRWFAEEVLIARGRHILIGYDARFGHRGAGDVALLERLAAGRGCAVERFAALREAGDVVSSSRIRARLEAGDVATAHRLLGRPFRLHGEVVHGEHLGRNLGFPTANLSPSDQIRPASGVYAAEVLLEGRRLPAVCNLGTRPTVAGRRWRAEAHVLNFDADLYGRRIDLELLHHLRGERRFADLDALKTQIAADLDRARTLLGLRAARRS